MSSASLCRAVVTGLIAIAMQTYAAAQQDTPPPSSRTAVIEQAQTEIAGQSHPFEPGKVEAFLDKAEATLLTGQLHFHPFFESAYAGGGFTLGAGYVRHVSSYNIFDVRGSFTFKGYKRVEAAFLAPRLFDRRGRLSAIGGWREATDVGFYGIGTGNTSVHDKATYSFDQPYAAAVLDVSPARNAMFLRGGLEVSQWNQGPGKSGPTVEDAYTTATLPGLGAAPVYLHSQAGAGIDTRPSPGYARHGGSYTIEFHDFRDDGGDWGFRRTDYEAIQHIPILRDTWVLSLHGRLEVANAADGQSIPFFMLPALGGGSSLRGFSSWRFRDRNALLLQADWRVIVNRFMDLALFYDAGRVADKRRDLLEDPLKSDYGIGFRLHGPLATPLRIEFARSNEGLALVFSSKAAF